MKGPNDAAASPESPGAAPRRASPAELGLLGSCWLVIAAAFFSMGTLDIPRDPAGPFLVRFAAAVLAWWVAGALTRTRDFGGLRAGVVFVFAGALLRMVAWNVPILLETDINRYLWDGFVLSEGFNPYEFPPKLVQDTQVALLGGEVGPQIDPDLLALAKLGRDPVMRERLVRINHKQLPTCYPPLTEYFFAFSAKLAPGDIATWKALVALTDVGVCVLILVLLRFLGRPPTWVLFYAWCPLPIKEYANTGHYDPLATALALAGVLFLMRRRAGWGGFFLGLGISAKLYPLVLVPVFWRRLGLRGAALALAVPALMLAPFLTIGPKLFDGLVAFAKDWEFNSSVFAAVNAVVEGFGLPDYNLTAYLTLAPAGTEEIRAEYLQELRLNAFTLSKLLTSAAMVAVLGVLAAWREDRDWSVPARALMALGALFLLSPVADPWYLPWALPYAAGFPTAAWAYLAGSAACYYAYFIEWRYLSWHRPLEYGPFFLALAASYRAGVTARFLRGYPVDAAARETAWGDPVDPGD